MSKFRASLLVLASTVVLTTAWGTAQQARPKLADYFTGLPQTFDPGYTPLTISSFPVTADLNGDGNEDLVVLGANYPSAAQKAGDTAGVVNVPQPGRVYLGDGNGHFSAAPTNLFPVDTLMTVHPRKVLFADFNGDGRKDMFISSHGWDVAPGPGEQNRLYLSLPGGGWRDATANLPQLNDYSHSPAVGDISGRGLIDIFVGNGYQGLNKIRPYTLLNTGSGQFTQVSTNIPVGNNQLLDCTTGHVFSGATFADLNGDGLPELIVTTNSNGKNPNSTVFWNRAGVFVETDTTALPAPDVFGVHHEDLDVQSIDVNRDGLPDLVLIGNQNGCTNCPLPSGWFVQIFINHGNGRFVDETAARIPPGEAWGGVEGQTTTDPLALWVRVLDFNQDGAADFAVEYIISATGLKQSQPLVWLNDGTGHFSTLKVGDFVTPGNESLLGGGHLMATRNGYSFITTQFSTGGGAFTTKGLNVVGLLATKPYRVTSIPSALRG
jgi:hypothetical protein